MLGVTAPINLERTYMKLSLLLLAFFTGAPAFALTPVYCSHLDDQVYLQVNDKGEVVSALYWNMDHGGADNTYLAPGEYSYQGSTLSFGGSSYDCSK